MMQLEWMPELIEQRQEYLRALAAPVAVGRRSGFSRQAAGRMVIRFGRWLEGRRPDVAVERPVTESWRSA